MEDMIIKGDGTSRYLKIPIDALTKYATLEDLLADMVAGTFQFDLNGINPEGFVQTGMPLNKPNLLTDSTASAFGLTATATPNQMFAQVPTAKMMWRQINAASALTDKTIDKADYLGVDDVSAATGKKITMQNLMHYVSAKSGESTFEKLIMGRLF